MCLDNITHRVGRRETEAGEARHLLVRRLREAVPATRVAGSITRGEGIVLYVRGVGEKGAGGRGGVEAIWRV
ncbi:hypothetical protein Pmani_019356 [Petrolisthes manimaculis]|uniref:Uncharacterized protein n=1 Tax=Petrolisthes manimaculis TaxID=1843537 RepID=A0AAE1PIC6_9EUCA|nr:hypothetical protein Pmani_019356 [Petrolisthes manimaculis]